MAYYLVKIAVTSFLIVAISESAKRSSLIGALLASIPLLSILAMLWVYIDTKDVTKVTALSSGIFWLVLPSMAFFVMLPLLLKQGFHFYLSMVISIGVTLGCYWLMIIVLNRCGINL